MQAPAVAGRDTPRALAIPIRATPMVATEPQGGTGNNRNHCLDQERGNQHEFRVYDLDAVINHHRNGTGCHPGTNHSANTYKNQDGRHALCNLGADLIHHLIPVMPTRNAINAAIAATMIRSGSVL